MRAARIGLGIVGVAMAAYAVAGAAADPGISPGRQLAFMAALLVGHEAVLLPAVILVGLLVVRFVPDWARAAVQAALLASAAVSVIGFVFILKAGRFPTNPSLLPLDYRRGLLAVLAAIWAVAAVVAVARRWRRRAVSEGYSP